MRKKVFLMKKLFLIIFIVLGGATAKIVASYQIADTPFNLWELLESLFFVIIFAAVLGVLFYREELKVLFGDSSKNKK